VCKNKKKKGGDDVNQLCDATDDEFKEIVDLVGMSSKPLHVKRLRKVIDERKEATRAKIKKKQLKKKKKKTLENNKKRIHNNNDNEGKQDTFFFVLKFAEFHFFKNNEIS
jgi:hypothetical protein